MEGNKLLTLLVTVTVGIIFIGALLAPVIEDTSATEKTFTNEGYFKMTDYSDVELTATYDSTANTFTVNGTDVIDLTSIDHTIARTIIACDTCALRLNPEGTLQFFIGNSNVPAGGADGDLTVTASNGSLSATNTAATPTTRTTTYETLYCISSDGDWTMKKSNVNALMNGDSFFMGAGLTAGSSVLGIVGLTLTGNIDDSAEFNVWRGTDITISNITVVTTVHAGYVDLYDLEKVTFTATDAENDSLDITYSYFIVPIEVTAELTQHLDAGEIAILAAIPIMAIAALILLVVRYFVAGRD